MSSDKEAVLNLFFEKKFEDKINEELLQMDYKFPKEELFHYVDTLCSIDYIDYVDYIWGKWSLEPVTSRNIYQFSSLNNSTTGICKALKQIENPGIRYELLGEILQNDGKVRSKVANTKYGENAAKTASELGLVYIIENYVFLSCIGYIFDELEICKRDKMLNLLIIRSVLFENLIYMTKYGKIEALEFMKQLSSSTVKRRISNIRVLIDQLRNANDNSFVSIVSKIGTTI